MRFPILAVLATAAQGFTIVSTKSTTQRLYAASVDANRVQVYADAASVCGKIRDIVESAAHDAIADHGVFYLAIPGGSILKMLAGLSGSWTDKTILAYVNHKCVSMDDLELATHAKAMNIFMNEWNCSPILLDGTADGEKEASSYAQKLVEANIPTSADGIPIFDLALIGVGDDGHVGSLYPNRNEVLDTSSTVLAVNMKSPPSITLSLPVMKSAKQVVIAACGVSDKYPQGKSDAMRRAIVEETETLESFPAIGLRDVATWIVDEAAASKLGEAYQTTKA